MSTTPEVPLPPAYEAFAARYKADPADPACADQIATYTYGWDDSTARSAADNAALREEIDRLRKHIEVPQPAPTDAHVSLAHELWAAAQLAPGEGIADGADRVAAILATQPDGQEAPDHIADVNKMVLDAARYRFLRDNEYASWRPYSLRAGYSATEADALVDAAMSAQAGGGKS